ncbi:DUF2490 domain-containing protein [Prosthecobacter sp.]|uniref:DUF2490 domain-containing protein n=1 Tax=Prosthecobacter sp. TaxID=1965333 RepID=UPI001DA5E694|nr:DUF2490 domain-containing protein [Prosthecobacter sp.]MCB1279144.1 DUF2490 domain-containing protein [Prosthecobacter sp.]
MRILLLILLSVLPLQADEWWAWNMVEFYHEPPWTAGLFMGNRADTEDGSYVQIVSPRAKYAVLPWLDLGLGLSTLSIENPNTHFRYEQLRPELEINPKFDLTKDLRLDWRNRMEWRKNENTAFTTHRTRHRLQLNWTLPQPVGPLTRVFVSNEWLADLHRGEWSENRLVPLGLTFNLGKNTDLDLFYMVCSSRPKTEWTHESVLGTYLRVRF